MKTRSFPATLLLAASALIPAPRALATALGEVTSVSPVGEPLRVEIRLPGGNISRAGECLRLGTSPTADGIPAIRQGRIGATGAGGDARIVVTHPAPVFDPLLRLVLEDVCDRLQREYTLLLPSPTEVPAVSGKDAPAMPTSAAPRPRQAAASVPWTTAPGESLASIAAALYPRDPAAQRRFIDAALRENPDLARSGVRPEQTLPAGTELRMPDRRRIASRPAPVQRREASPQPRSDGTPREEKPTGETRTRKADRLVIAPEHEAPGRPAPADGGEDLRAREQQLVQAVDRSIAMQLELLERIRRLEEIHATLTQRAEELGALAEQAAVEPPSADADADADADAGADEPPTDNERLPAPVPQPPAEASGGWIGPGTALAALAALLAAAVIALRRRRRAETFEPEDMEQDIRASAVPLPERTTEAGERKPPNSRESLLQPPDYAPVDWDHPDTAIDVATIGPMVTDEESPEEHESAIELAEIMMSFGRVQGAAETLAEFIRANPKQAVTPWLKLLDVYRAAGLRAEFDGLAHQLNKTFNVKTVNWENYDAARTERHSLEEMPHIIASLQKQWRTRECQAYLEKLLRDNRDGTRQGFPLPVIDDLLMLAAVLEDELGRYHDTEAADEPAQPQHQTS